MIRKPSKVPNNNKRICFLENMTTVFSIFGKEKLPLPLDWKEYPERAGRIWGEVGIGNSSTISEPW